MKQLFFILSLLSLTSCLEKRTRSEEIITGAGIELAEEAGVKIALHTSSLDTLSLVEIFDVAQGLNVKYIEVSPNHKIGGAWQNKKFDYSLSAEDQKLIKELAGSFGIKIVGLGIYDSSREEDWERLFNFAKSMELEYISCNPLPNQIDILENQAIKNNMKVGIYNDSEISLYINPDSLLAVLEKHSQVEASVNTLNWFQKGIDHIEALEIMEGKITSLYLSDIKPLEEKKAVDYSRWGDGILDIAGILIELNNQQFEGYLVFKQESEGDESQEKLKGSIYYYDTIAEYIFKK